LLLTSADDGRLDGVCGCKKRSKEVLEMGPAGYSVSRAYGFGGMKFAPLIARDFRCTIFRRFAENGQAYRD